MGLKAGEGGDFPAVLVDGAGVEGHEIGESLRDDVGEVRGFERGGRAG